MKINQKIKMKKNHSMKYRVINFWDFPHKIMLVLETEFRKNFFMKVVSYFGTSLKAGDFLTKKAEEIGVKRNFTGSYIRRYKTSDKKDLGIAQWIIKELALKLNWDLDEIQRNILGYRAQRGSTIKNPKLPIKVTPEFNSVLCHIICDGTEKRTKNIAASYTQYNFIGRINFYQKLLNVFGKIDPPSFSKKRKGKDVGIPKAILLIIKKYYGIEKIGTFESKLPKQFFFQSKEHRLATLCAFLIDEGSIYDFISLRMKNLNLIKSLRKISLSLGYKCSQVNKFKGWTGTYVYGFNISNFSLKKIAEGIKHLSRKHPTCNLSYKQAHFEIIASQKRTSERTRYFGETKKLILTFLKENPQTTMELAKLTNISRRTARIHLEELKKAAKVRISHIKSKGAKVWMIKK